MHHFTREDYADQLRRLMPRGRAWNLHPDGVLMRFLDAVAGYLAKVEARASDVVDKEQFPSKTEELFEEWETELGLPDICRGERETLDQRRFDLIAKYNETGGQSIPYFIEIGKSLGLDITIEEFRAFRVGQDTCGMPIQDDYWYFVWRVLWLLTRITEFKVGQDTCGTPLRSWTTNEALECILNRLGPAHAHVIVAYVDPEHPEPDTILLKR